MGTGWNSRVASEQPKSVLCNAIMLNTVFIPKVNISFALTSVGQYILISLFLKSLSIMQQQRYQVWLIKLSVSSRTFSCPKTVPGFIILLFRLQSSINWIFPSLFNPQLTRSLAYLSLSQAAPPNKAPTTTHRTPTNTHCRRSPTVISRKHGARAKNSWLTNSLKCTARHKL